nr:helix-turn-helix domain-containing protein [Pseudomonas sp. Root569]
MQVREIKALLKDPEIQVANVAIRYGVSRTTLYRYLRKSIHDSFP